MGADIEIFILKEKIRKEVKRMLSEESDIFSDDEKPDAQPSPSQAPKSSKSQEDVKVATKDVEKKSDDNLTLDSLIQKLNTIRSGRSFKDEEIMSQMEKYYNDLQEPEKKALQSFLLGLSQIVTAGVSGESAPEPSDPPANVKMLDKEKIKKKEIKPNIIKKGGQTEPSKSLEDTSPPVNVKNR